VRSGGPVDDEADYELPVWAGVLPLEETPLTPQRDERLPEDIPLPEYIARYVRRKP
jgi:hypothetical protein